MIKETIVILHGWTKNHKYWRPLIKNLERRDFRVIYPVLPGFGKEKMRQAWSARDYVGWLLKFLKQKQISNFYLVAHSNGGRIALQLVSEHPGRIKKLILINSAGIKPTFTFKQGVFWLLAKLGKIGFSFPALKQFKPLARRLLYRLARERDYLEADQVLRQTMLNLIKKDFKKILKKIKTPTLLLWGGRDKTTPLRDGLLMNSKILQSQFILFPKASHALPYQEGAIIAQEISSFCRS